MVNPNLDLNSSDSQPSALSGFLNTNQWNPRSLALWIQQYDNATFLKWGGDNTLFQPSTAYVPAYNNAIGQVQGPLELRQLQSLAPVETYIVTHPSEAVAEERKLGLGFQSPNDPNYFVAYWSPDKDANVVSAALDQGEPLNAVITSLKGYGYPDSTIADIIVQVCSNYFQSVRGDGNYWHVASVLGFPYDYQVLEPVYSINPYTPTQQQSIAAQDASFVLSPTGSFVPGVTVWANHLGGEVVNVCFPFADKNTQSVASLIHTVLLTYFDPQNQAILYGIHSNFDDIIKNALPDVANRMVQYCQQVGNQYNFGDMISPTPFTPSQLKYLSQSQFYNPIQVHPPTFGDSVAITVLASPLTGIGPWVPFNQSPQTGATYENLHSDYSRNPDFIAYVLKNYARRLHLWMAQSKLPLIPEVSLLKPFADLYDT